MKRNLILTVCLLILAVSLTACGKSPQETPAEGQPAPDDAGVEAAEPADITGPLPLTGGASQDEAEEIRINTKYAGTYSDELWVSFTTGTEPSE
jgi:predicted small lipoprotein YifL